MEAFPANHLESFGPETLFVGSLLRGVQLAEAVDHFDLRRFQGCQFLFVKVAICDAPSLDEFANPSYCAIRGGLHR
jgi:hypothetical protein